MTKRKPTRQFGRWTVLEIVDGTWAECRCRCGTTRRVRVHNLRASRGSRSCGCARRESTARRCQTHGHSRRGHVTGEYRAWAGMRTRCLNPNSAGFGDYGGRGIRICKRWDRFEQFLADMGPMPRPNMTLERVRVDGGYRPSNCVWLDRRKQSRNRRNTVWMELDGERLTLTECGIRLGVGQSLMSKLVKKFGAARAVAVAKERYGP